VAGVRRSVRADRRTGSVLPLVDPAAAGLTAITTIPENWPLG
jgi:hypothetical protein